MLESPANRLKQWYPTFFGVGAEFQISEYVWNRMKTLK